MDIARRFFRVIECDDNTWACRDGRDEVDRHDHQDEALEHLAVIASEHRPSRIYLHRLDGRVLALVTLD